jgi:hypothetical protein
VTTGERINFEEASTMTITVTAVDNGVPPLNISKDFVVAVQNANDLPELDYECEAAFCDGVDESTPVGTVVGHMLPTDEDTQQTLTVTLVEDLSGGALGLASDGRSIEVLAPITMFLPRPLSLRLRARDSGNPQAQSAVETVLVANNAATTTTSTTSTSSTTSTTSTSVTTTTTSTSSTSSTTVFNGTTVTSTSSTTSTTSTTTTSSTSSTTSTTSTTSTPFNVAPLGLVHGSIVVGEDTPVGRVITTLLANDPNVGQTHIFTLLSDPSGKFELIFFGGLKLIRPLDAETSLKHRLEISIQDDGSPPLSTRVEFTVNVRDINERPDFVLEPFGALPPNTVFRSMAEGSSIFYLRILDPDVSQRGNHIISVTGPAAPYLSASQTILSARREIDVNAPSPFRFTVTITDTGRPALTVTKSFSMTLTSPPAGFFGDGAASTSGSSVSAGNIALFTLAALAAVGMIGGTVYWIRYDKGRRAKAILVKKAELMERRERIKTKLALIGTYEESKFAMAGAGYSLGGHLGPVEGWSSMVDEEAETSFGDGEAEGTDDEQNASGTTAAPRRSMVEEMMTIGRDVVGFEALGELGELDEEIFELGDEGEEYFEIGEEGEEVFDLDAMDEPGEV